MSDSSPKREAAPSISETTTIEYNRWLVENEAKTLADERKGNHDEERALRKELTERYRMTGSDHVSEYKDQMTAAKSEVENFRNDNLKKGAEVKEEVEALRRARKAQTDSWLEHGSELSREYGSEQRQRIAATIGETKSKKHEVASTMRGELTEIERMRAERQQRELADARALKDAIISATSDEVTKEAKQHFFDQRKAVGDDTRGKMKAWKETRSAEKSDYAAKAATAKNEARAAAKAAKEAVGNVREMRAKVAKEMRDKRNNLDVNHKKVRTDMGSTKKQVHDMTRQRKFVSASAADAMLSKRAARTGGTPKS